LNAMSQASDEYVSRGGNKLAVALDNFRLDVGDKTCADLGSHVGGFVDCLLRRGARLIFSIDTAYGVLAWKLRKDPRVTVIERTNAMHVTLPQTVDIVTIDLGWTRQSRILPNVARLITPAAHVVTLVKPHYEAQREQLTGGILPDGAVEGVVSRVLQEASTTGWTVEATTESPIRGHGGNREVFALLRRSETTHGPNGARES